MLLVEVTWSGHSWENNMVRTQLVEVTWLGPQLVGGNMVRTQLEGGNMARTQLVGGNMVRTQLVEATWSGHSWLRTQLVEGNMVRTQLVEVEYGQTQLVEVDTAGWSMVRTQLVEFTSTEVAEKATKSGLLAFTYSIPYHQIQQEQYHHTRTCLRCYAIEDHDSVNCPKPKEYKICSKCLNCDGPHSIMSMNCPKRKEKIKEAQQKATKTSVSPYKAVLPIGTPTPAVTARTYRDVVLVGTPTPAVTAQDIQRCSVGPDFPTFYSRNSATTPVIAITNGRCFHNYLYEQGPVISSDHLPIIMTISATTITIPAPPRRIAKQTDWELFNEKATAELEAKDMKILKTIDSQPVNRIDEEINTWCEAYQEATPLKRNRLQNS
ncbi:hypothetical protein Hamer_G000544 [Homarus americanus]|uniref:Uncharacterized protein n=1 Tax=Homarus americanus TaxID=6706 RepID=A0A8J5NC41_HOMAM|nr:hypothetical protein Hamer_G000544 [Homarus americanus]